MTDVKTAIVFAIIVVIFIEAFSCFFADWCVGSPKREGLNTAMFAINFTAALAAYFATMVLVTPAVTTNVFISPAPSEKESA